MNIVYVCAPAAKLIPELADALYDGHAPEAVTVGDTVFVFIPDPTDRLLRHEEEHVRQAERMQPRWLKWWPWAAKRAGWLRFWKAYGEEYLERGYWDNCYEVEARRAAGQEE